MTAEQVRRVRGGVIGGFTPVQVRVVVPEEGIEAGDIELGLKVPAGHFLYGVAIRNTKGDLEADGDAVFSLSAGGEGELRDIMIEDLKGKGFAKIVEEPVYVEQDTDTVLGIESATLTKGTLDIGIIYG